jgi:fused signal recognition particle receptor
MFGKLKNKLKEWTQKVSKVEEDSEEKEIIDNSASGGREEPQSSEEGGGAKKPKKEKKEKKRKSKKKELPTDEELQEELKNGDYVEPELKFNEGRQLYEPDTEKFPAPFGGGVPNAPHTEVDINKTVEKIKKPFLKKLVSKEKTISPKEFEEHAEELEMILLENNVAMEVSEKIIDELKEEIIGKPMNKKQIEETLTNTLKNIIEKVLVEPFDIIKEIKDKKEPYVILFCGINGTGKTTTIAKFTNMLKKKGFSCVLAAGDTFRAAAVEQLKKHGEKLDVKVLSQNYGADPAAVGFDAIKYAQKNKTDVVLIDTAGRIHTATNLIREMEKIKKVCKPDRTLFVGESITGNDATDQVKAFNDNIEIDGIILSKADIDEKGGTALSVGYTTNKPILFLGTGQEYKDIEPFDKQKFIEKLEL